MDLSDDRRRAGIPIGVAGKHRFVPPQKHIIHAPCVDGKALNVRKLSTGRLHSRPDRSLQGLYVPDKMALPLLYPVGEPVNLPGLNAAVGLPADNVPSAGRADIYRKIILHAALLLSAFRCSEAPPGEKTGTHWHISVKNQKKTEEITTATVSYSNFRPLSIPRRQIIIAGK